VTEQKGAVAAGAAAYTPLLLRLYDAAVVYASNSLLWRCSRHVQLANYQANLGMRHLDIGPGTGWYINHVDPTLESLTLLDLNPNSLDAAASTLARYDPVRVTGNILEPLHSSLSDLDSVGANFLFHCVPGDWAAKGAAFGEIAKVLAPTGTFFGASILGAGAQASVGARAIMRLYQHLGIFHNADDTLEGLRAALSRYFADVDVQVVGCAAVFRAAQPR
jgi:SAM-dependent methyltransferase